MTQVFDIDFLDPDAKKKIKYNRHLLAVKNFIEKNNLTRAEHDIIIQLHHRRRLNLEIAARPDFDQLANLIGWVRVLFKLFDFELVQKDLRAAGLHLTFPRKEEENIKREFRKRNPEKRSPKRKQGKFEVHVKRRKSWQLPKK